MSRSSVISAGSKTTAEAAADVIHNGGNAFDAAVAGVFMSMVAEPALTSAGGGGYLLAYPENRNPKLYDFFVNMPKGRCEKPDFFSIEIDFGDTQQEFYIGKGSVATPGNIAGLLYVQKKLGKIPLREVLIPSINAAKNGIELNHHQTYILDILKPIMCYSENGKRIYYPNNQLIQSNELFKMEEFADFLETLSREGEDFFYKGEIAELIVDFQNNDGYLNREDFEKYNVYERKPIITPFNDYHVLGNPPPSVSGLLVDFILQLLQSRNINYSNHISIKEMVYALEITELARVEYFQYFPKQIEINNNDIFEKYKNKFLSKNKNHSINKNSSNRNGSTTHISVIDAFGNAASVTTTNGEGCGYVLPQAGFMLNNMLGEEDLSPKGFHKHSPGKRLPSMVAPTIVLKDGNPVLVTGTAGSNRIRSVIVQMIINTLCNNMNISKATETPRVHLEGDILHVEPGIPDNILDELSNSFNVYQWTEKNVYFGGANSVLNSEGMGDPRRGGHTIII